MVVALEKGSYLSEILFTENDSFLGANTFGDNRYASDAASEVSFKSENNGSDADDDQKPSPTKKLKKTARINLDPAATPDVKDEIIQDGGMDGTFEASFTMPGEI